MRDFQLLKAIQNLDDATLVGPMEVAALLNLAEITVRQRKLPVGFPDPVGGMRLLRWRLGEVRLWIRGE